ncbi:class A beta-lactamase-related serine hydrolase, partial [bacterium]
MFAPFLLALPQQVEMAALDAAFSKAVANRGAPASVALLVRDGRVVWSKAAGTSDLAGQHPATLDTPFRIASLTKAFTATLVLQLVAEKKVGLDDPIGGVLPQLPKAWRGATVRHLLNHTSGIPDYTAQPLFALKLTERTTPEDLVARTADKPLDFPSGTKFKYDNTGYVILGMLVERLDRQPFGASLQRRILNPLGMTRTVFDQGEARNVAEGTGPTGRPAQKIHMSQPYAAGSIVSTANDMAKWLAAQGSERLLPKPLWDEAGKAVILPDGTSTRYGFGWLVAKMNGV